MEVKAGLRPAGIASVNQAFNLKQSDQFDRAMVISRSGVTAEAFRHADTIGLGRLDLLGPTDLRNWLAKQVQTEETDGTYDSIVRTAMRKLVRLIAESPENLANLEWRELEKVCGKPSKGLDSIRGLRGQEKTAVLILN